MIDSFDGEYRFLSNFYQAEVKYSEWIYPSVENAYQASKCIDDEVCFNFISMTAVEAKRAGKMVAMKPNFEFLKFDIMLDLVKQKFRHKHLADMLLTTGQEELVEGNWWKDIYWGVCNGRGENNLGKILMQVRAELFLERESQRA